MQRAGGPYMAALGPVVQRPFWFAKALRVAISVVWKSESGFLGYKIYLAEAYLLERWLQEGG